MDKCLVNNNKITQFITGQIVIGINIDLHALTRHGNRGINTIIISTMDTKWEKIEHCDIEYVSIFL